jgi:hypothetical protein
MQDTRDKMCLDSMIQDGERETGDGRQCVVAFELSSLRNGSQALGNEAMTILHHPSLPGGVL